MDSSNRQPRDTTRRIPLTVSLTAQTHRALHAIGNGNRSRAIERLVADYQARLAAASTLLTADSTP